MSGYVCDSLSSSYPRLTTMSKLQNTRPMKKSTNMNMFVALVVSFCQSQAKEMGRNTASKNIKSIAMVSLGALQGYQRINMLSLHEACKQMHPAAGFRGCLNPRITVTWSCLGSKTSTANLWDRPLVN